MAAAVVAMLVVLVAPIGLAGGSVVLGTACAEATPAQATVNIGVVVDFGVLRPGSISVTCVPVAPGTGGYDMLSAAGHTYRVDDSGLVCAIDGLPAQGCGERTPTGYRYWAYFHGSGSAWSYSSIGPQGYRAAAGTVEGWHFVEGAGNPSDPPPGRAPTNICPAAPPPTVAPTTAPPPVTTARPASPDPGAPAPGGPGPAPGAPGPLPGAPTSTTTAAAGPADGAAGADVDPGSSSPPGTGADEAAASGSSPGTTSIGADGVASDVTVLAAAQNPADPTDSGAPVATLLVVLVVVALGAVAAWRFRGRADPTS
jgi:hypothetical protein